MKLSKFSIDTSSSVIKILLEECFLDKTLLFFTVSSSSISDVNTSEPLLKPVSGLGYFIFGDSNSPTTINSLLKMLL